MGYGCFRHRCGMKLSILLMNGMAITSLVASFTFLLERSNLGFIN